MSDYIWMSVALGRTSIMKPMTHSFADDPLQLQQALVTRRKNDAGESISAEHFPKKIFGAPSAREHTYKLPNIFFAGSFWVISSAAADVMREFDMGGGGLYPVSVFKKDRVTPVDKEWFCINFGNLKHAFLPDQSDNKSDHYIRPGHKGWTPRATLNDLDFAFNATAVAGADIWLEYDVGDAFFVSGALGNALKKAGADKGFHLKKCRVITA